MNRRPEVDAVAILARALERGSFFRVVVPSRTPRGHRLRLDSWAPRVLDLIIPLVGGATELRATGHWLNERRARTTEAVRLLDFYILRALSRPVAVGLAVALQSIAVQMRQEALAIAVEHRLHLLRPQPNQRAALDTLSRRRFITRMAVDVPPARHGRRAARSAHA